MFPQYIVGAHMRVLSRLSAAVLGFALSTGGATAQTEGPAELPPPAFAGKQFVDSKGCVFVRAGFDGAVTWVPRVARNRKVICGMTPTFGASTTTAQTTQQPVVVEPAPAPAPARVPVRNEPERVVVASGADLTSPKSPRAAAPFQRVPQQVSPKSPRPQAVRTTQRVKRKAKAPAPVRQVQQVRSYGVPQQVVSTQYAKVQYVQPQVSNCVRYSSNLPKRGHFGKKKYTPRCTPQAMSPYGLITVHGAQAPQQVVQHQQVMHRQPNLGQVVYQQPVRGHQRQGGVYASEKQQVVTNVHVHDEVVVEEQLVPVANQYRPLIQARRPTATHHDPHFGNPRPHVHNGGHLGLFRRKPTVAIVGTPRPVRVPHGYRPLWQDDRLNRYRAMGTPQGDIEMRLVWSNTLPRRLIDSRSGRDVSALYPNIIYPYPAQPLQGAPLPGVRYVNGYPAHVAPATGVRPRTGHLSTRARTQRSTTQVRVSTKAVQPRSTTQAASHRFVEVGTFSNPNAARNSIARLQQMGLPVRTGSYQRRGKTLQIVLAGPFAQQSSLQNALSATRRAGFSNARPRK